MVSFAESITTLRLQRGEFVCFATVAYDTNFVSRSFFVSLLPAAAMVCSYLSVWLCRSVCQIVMFMRQFVCRRRSPIRTD